jgi:transcriptional regulator with XRE-family HTH domain
VALKAPQARPRHHFGEKLREVRERRQLTLKEVARRAGLSESLISQIERNKVAPTLDTLLAIVDVLDLDLEYLFREVRRDRLVNLVKKADRQKISLKKMTYEQLSRTVEADEAHGLEAYLLELKPGGESQSSEYGHAGKELGVVISGRGEFTIGGRTYPLHEGDSLSFAANVPHVLRNTGPGPLKAFWVVTPPKGYFGR